MRKEYADCRSKITTFVKSPLLIFDRFFKVWNPKRYVIKQIGKANKDGNINFTSVSFLPLSIIAFVTEEGKDQVCNPLFVR